MSLPPEFVEPSPSLPGQSERQWAALAHASALLGAVITGTWFGWGCFIGPLVIWLAKRDSMPFVAVQAREALNFNITAVLVGLVLGLFTLVTFGIGALLAVPLALIVGLGWLIWVLVATVKTHDGQDWRYPFMLRLVR